MTDPTHYRVYPYKTLGCALLIIGLCLVNCASMASYAEGYLKTTTDMTLEARHIIVGDEVEDIFNALYPFLQGNE